MRRKHVIYLLSAAFSQNDMGDMVQTVTERKIFAERKSVRQSEFYQSQAIGLRPEIMFGIWTSEYNQESQLKYEGKVYNIIRTYDKDERNIELICSGLVVT